MSQERNVHGSHWTFTLTAIVLILAWIGYWYGNTLEAMAQIWWRAETYTHGLVVPPITLWLIWRDRQATALMQPRVTYWLTIPLLALVFLWLIGDLTAVNSLTQFSVIGLIVSAIMSLVGLPISKQLSFPLLFLFFAVPVGDFLLPILMEWTADFTVTALRFSGIPVFREGQNFVIPSGQWSVIEACSGVRYLIASLTVGTLYAYLTYTTLKRRLLFIVVALLVPILANWLRAYLIVMLGHISGNKLAVGVDHLIYGWVFFGVVITIMFGIGMRWSEPSIEKRGLEQNSRSTTDPDSAAFAWFNFAVIALVIAAGPIVELSLQHTVRDKVINLSPPETNGAWQAGPPHVDWKPRFINPSAELQSTYSIDEHWVGLYIAYYRNQNYDSKLVSSINVLAGSTDPNWHVVSNSSANIALDGNNHLIRTSDLLQMAGAKEEHFVVWQWYWVNGQLTSSDLSAKWLTAWAMLTGRGDDSAVVIIYAPKAGAEEILPAFVKKFGPEINHKLAEAKYK